MLAYELKALVKLEYEDLRGLVAAVIGQDEVVMDELGTERHDIFDQS